MDLFLDVSRVQTKPGVPGGRHHTLQRKGVLGKLFCNWLLRAVFWIWIRFIKWIRIRTRVAKYHPKSWKFHQIITQNHFLKIITITQKYLARK